MAGYTEDIHRIFENLTCVLSSFGDEDEEEKTPINMKMKMNEKLRAKTAPLNKIHHQPDTSRFLRKNQSFRRAPDIDRDEYKCVLNSRRPPVPKETTPKTPRPKVNFIEKNLKNTHSMAVKPTGPIVVTGVKGERRDLTNFVDARRLKQSHKFGEVPKYLISRRKAWHRAEAQRKEEMRRAKIEEESMPGFRLVDEFERSTLLKGLKDRWMEVHKEFQVLPVLCDTTSKAKRKIVLEKQLGILEKDIELLEANPFIYIDSNPK